jgi:hypothetical protein
MRHKPYTKKYLNKIRIILKSNTYNYRDWLQSSYSKHSNWVIVDVNSTYSQSISISIYTIVVVAMFTLVFTRSNIFISTVCLQ